MVRSAAKPRVSNHEAMEIKKRAIPTDGPNSDGSKAAFAYSMTSTIRWVRGSTRTVRPFTTV
jgi:hypothetical protein